MAGMAAVPINSFSVMYAKSLNMGMGNWADNGMGIGNYRLGMGGVQTLVYFCSLCLAYPLGSLVDRFHTLRISIAATAVYAVVTGLAEWVELL